MFLAFLFAILPKKEFKLGQGTITRYTLFECKWLFSIYIHDIDSVSQDRFHTHAFNALVYILKGSYSELIKVNSVKVNSVKINNDAKHENNSVIRKTYRRGQFRYIPRLLNHKIEKSEPHTTSLSLTGPYSSMWTEELDDGTLYVLTAGRKVLYKAKIN